MTYAIPWYITGTVVLVGPVLATIVWAILARVATRPVRFGSAIFFAAWYVALLILAPSLSSLDSRPAQWVNPLVGIFAAVPSLIVALAAAFSPAVRRTLGSASLPALTAVQAYRVLGVMFFILLAQGQLPARFALEAGWGDVIVGALALPVASALRRGAPGSRLLAAGWNVLGLADLFTAVSLGTGVLFHQPAPVMGAFPMILIPGFGVTISLILHVTSLVRLVRLEDRKTVFPRAQAA
jgi:hypothetical protein